MQICETHLPTWECMTNKDGNLQTLIQTFLGMWK